MTDNCTSSCVIAHTNHPGAQDITVRHTFRFVLRVAHTQYGDGAVSSVNEYLRTAALLSGVGRSTGFRTFDRLCSHACKWPLSSSFPPAVCCQGLSAVRLRIHSLVLQPRSHGPSNLLALKDAVPFAHEVEARFYFRRQLDRRHMFSFR